MSKKKTKKKQPIKVVDCCLPEDRIDLDAPEFFDITVTLPDNCCGEVACCERPFPPESFDPGPYDPGPGEYWWVQPDVDRSSPRDVYEANVLAVSADGQTYVIESARGVCIKQVSKFISPVWAEGFRSMKHDKAPFVQERVIKFPLLRRILSRLPVIRRFFK